MSKLTSIMMKAVPVSIAKKASQESITKYENHMNILFGYGKFQNGNIYNPETGEYVGWYDPQKKIGWADPKAYARLKEYAENHPNEDIADDYYDDDDYDYDYCDEDVPY